MQVYKTSQASKERGGHKDKPIINVNNFSLSLIFRKISMACAHCVLSKVIYALI